MAQPRSKRVDFGWKFGSNPSAKLLNRAESPTVERNNLLQAQNAAN